MTKCQRKSDQHCATVQQRCCASVRLKLWTREIWLKLLPLLAASCLLLILPVWIVDAVPDTQVAPALRHHHITARHPLHVLTEAEQAAALLSGQVEKVQLMRLVSEQQVAAPAVQLLHTHRPV